MSLLHTPALKTLAHYLAGKFDNREQAIAEPTWYVSLTLWQRPTPLFADDSITLFIEQANSMTLDQPYRQRILRLQATSDGELQGQYYALKDFTAWKGAASDRQRLQQLTSEHLDLLPGCLLTITCQHNQFDANLSPGSQCSFTYQGKTTYVSLGFQASGNRLLVYDKGIDPVTGQGLWGALMGPFQFSKREDFSHELP
ncbi:MAG: chromophore lyase CpcT/CpeT [Cyanobacteria bacterium]|nr:chromophore lyase CpcT/CpeT [Cyanobacteriota bacterium]MDW8200499.1 chromophore lyase CpcT/CpeT [Cyanobacteriota bacterium SKYGB_h_bin112]